MFPPVRRSCYLESCADPKECRGATRIAMETGRSFPSTDKGICPCVDASCGFLYDELVRALSSAVRAFGLHPKGRPFKSDSAHHCDAIPFSGDVVQLVRALPCRWLESDTVTAEPQNQLSHRASSHLECQPCLSILRLDFKGAGVRRHQSRPAHGRL